MIGLKRGGRREYRIVKPKSNSDGVSDGRLILTKDPVNTKIDITVI